MSVRLAWAKNLSGGLTRPSSGQWTAISASDTSPARSFKLFDRANHDIGCLPGVPSVTPPIEVVCLGLGPRRSHRFAQSCVLSCATFMVARALQPAAQSLLRRALPVRRIPTCACLDRSRESYAPCLCSSVVCIRSISACSQWASLSLKTSRAFALLLLYSIPQAGEQGRYLPCVPRYALS